MFVTPSASGSLIGLLPSIRTTKKKDEMNYELQTNWPRPPLSQYYWYQTNYHSS